MHGEDDEYMIVVLTMSRRIVSYYDDSDIGEEDAIVSFDI